jgi:hypothetical protein
MGKRIIIERGLWSPQANGYTYRVIHGTRSGTGGIDGRIVATITPDSFLGAEAQAALDAWLTKLTEE